ncbi:uncharacterized protein LOC115633641 [Scaptodrosophila lebanonensis]|uniref:Uncharacterized protein LOC115633641 n=1 Tax=Drosophila lebanonensis TaxID=7225 RepID=A0A6J2UIB1_DROLE|nr:uncharacterized protein LOC115633641 [Scaptodrosophila lebanonensis]XP_030386942.1 uncharacterized protein LOC115633641 [Scaptodrosophila lebanonensis]
MQYTTGTENYSTSSRDPNSKWGGRNDKGYSYKKSSYQYSSSGDNNVSYQSKSSDQNIDQLDALLEDLKNERQISTRERDLLPTSNNYKTLERSDPAGTVIKTTRVIKTTKHAGGQAPLTDDIETFNTTDYSTLKSSKYSSFQDNLKRDEYQSTLEKPYSLAHSPSGGGHYESKTKIYESNRTLNNAELVPNGGTTSKTVTTTSNIDRELQDIALSDGILPAPGTKVTTTVRTYTYEIPATGPGSTTNTINRNNTNAISSYQHHESLNSSQNYTQSPPNPLPHPHPHVPQTVVYNTESYSTLNRPNDRPVVTNQSYEIREHKETTNTLHNSGGVGGPQSRQLPLTPAVSPNSPPGTNRTIVYNIHKTDNVHTVNELPPPQRYPHSPAHSPNPNYGGPNSPPLQNIPPGGTTNRYFYKETSNTVNTIHGPPNGGIPYETTPLAPIKQAPNTAYPQQPPTGNGYPPQGDGYPPNTTSYTYKYSSSTNTNNRRGPGPDYGTPSPFPVDGVEYPVANGNPPQRVDDLMQSFGTTDHVDRVDIETPHRKREIETAVASPNQQHVPSVNKAGKEVYYPPGHDTITLKREEMHAGSAQGGRWAKGSGMYEYESGYKSKTKTKSGGAMVPVCLPLCCAMPCSIM